MKGEHKIVSVYGRNIQKARAFAEKYGATAFDDFEKLCQKRALGYEARIHTDQNKGITLESLNEAGRAWPVYDGRCSKMFYQ